MRRMRSSGSHSESTISSSSQARSMSTPCGGLPLLEKKLISWPFLKVITEGTDSFLFSQAIEATRRGGINGGAALHPLRDSPALRARHWPVLESRLIQNAPARKSFRYITWPMCFWSLPTQKTRSGPLGHLWYGSHPQTARATSTAAAH